MFKSDGNGNIVLSKGMIAILTFIILLCSTVASAVAFSIGIKGEVAAQGKSIDRITEVLDKLEGRITANEKETTKLDTCITNIDKTLSEIKSTLKDLRDDT